MTILGDLRYFRAAVEKILFSLGRSHFFGRVGRVEIFFLTRAKSYVNFTSHEASAREQASTSSSPHIFLF